MITPDSEGIRLLLQKRVTLDGADEAGLHHGQHRDGRRDAEPVTARHPGEARRSQAALVTG